MNEKLEAWIQECVSNGTFRNIDDAIEFCVGATKAFCEYSKINRESVVKSVMEELNSGNATRLSCIEFPLKWSDELEAYLRGGNATGTMEGDWDVVKGTYMHKKRE